MSKRSVLSILYNVLFSMFPFLLGVYVLLEKKMYVGGSLSAGRVHHLEFPADIIMGISFFLISISILTGITNLKHKNKIIEILFISALILFGISVFMS